MSSAVHPVALFDLIDQQMVARADIGAYPRAPVGRRGAEGGSASAMRSAVHPVALFDLIDQQIVARIDIGAYPPSAGWATRGRGRRERRAR
jgi:hypothetical protein